ncbi:MAG: endonuclease/exonuclease/phosphatase family protein [Gammaproteobacteria bacterium]|nr:endonuclease/exonuclease/phosphatase family protein [Gammaproteobacteria bacterium]MBU2059903.1 endonuclease/exonuclease/phosphatase family protein [Gammaproteobacteria bacterium]MBU2175842.1 endonuclease/exonuclease/phosphatase family protein [Gammaproteobacteria bacterium]MBU2247665.1 endonuclease/exonuclease/phosphatase family protein [Gammaproteobacteria bacterium]MBU2346476.1 endonuclease/exonuclease/phosphatase family protein [Gammaproteobacteria bacterium]
MKFLLLILSSLVFPSLAQAESLKLMSYNIRCGLCEAEGTPQYWPERKFLLAHLIQTQQPDLIGLQEAELFQVHDLVAMLPQYQWFGEGRDDGKTKGESTAVLYRKDKLQLLSAKTLWLSETPDQVSKGWDAKLNRTFTKTQFKELKSNQSFYFLNTHFDHMGKQAQLQSALLLKAEVEKLPKQSKVLLTGDFNVEPDSAPYQALSKVLHDSALVAKDKLSKNVGTFNGFGREPNNTSQTIDFIFVSKNLQVASYQVDNRRYNGLYPSDHEALLAVVELD